MRPTRGGVRAQVGEFYEAQGTDAVVLVQWAWLNPMGRKPPPRAGAPVVNLRRTLDDILQGSGLSIVRSRRRCSPCRVGHRCWDLRHTQMTVWNSPLCASGCHRVFVWVGSCSSRGLPCDYAQRPGQGSLAAACWASLNSMCLGKADLHALWHGLAGGVRGDARAVCIRLALQAQGALCGRHCDARVAKLRARLGRHHGGRAAGNAAAASRHRRVCHWLPGTFVHVCSFVL